MVCDLFCNAASLGSYLYFIKMLEDVLSLYTVEWKVRKCPCLPFAVPLTLGAQSI